jgi:glycosyltransferase involved in cell wall biosynthesis
VSAPLRVLLVGSPDDGPGHPRLGLLRRALGGAVDDRGRQVALREVLVPPPWAGVAKRVLLRRPWRWPAVWRGLASVRREVVARLLDELEREGTPDLVVVPYPGHAVVSAVRSVYRGPLVLDLFLSMHLTFSDGPSFVTRLPGGARLLRARDRGAVAAADLVLLDTPHHAAAVASDLDVDAGSFDWLPIGDLAAPPAAVPARPRVEGPLRVLFFGTGVPLHGLTTLLDAAERDGGRTFVVEVIGGAVSDRARARGSSCVRLGPAFVDTKELAERIAASDVVAGVFGTSRKADVVVPYKVVHGLAHGRPVVTADTRAVRDLLDPGRDCLVVPAGDAPALERRLVELAADDATRLRIGAAARARFERSFSERSAARRMASVLARVVPGSFVSPGRDPTELLGVQPQGATSRSLSEEPTEPSPIGSRAEP